MAEVPEVILKISVDSQGVVADIDKIKAKYGEIGAAVRENKIELSSLLAEEKNLLAARAKTNSPTVIAQYNSKLKETRDQIAKVNSELLTQNSALKETTKQAQGTGAALGKAFDTTAAKSLRTQLRGLKEELARATDPAEVARLATAAGHLQEEINSATHSANIFGGSKFAAVGNALGDIGHKIISLDFAGAAKSSQLLLQATKNINFADAIKGVKDMGTTLVNVGKSLLINPLFILSAVIGGIALAVNGMIDSFHAGDKALEDSAERLKKVTEATENLIRANRDLAVQNEIDAGKISKTDGEKLKNRNKLIDALIQLKKDQNAEEKKLNDDFEKEREEDSFRQTKNLFEALGGQTDESIKHKNGLLNIEQTFQKQKEQLLKGFSEQDKKILIDDAKVKSAKQTKINDDALKEKERQAKLLTDLEAANISNQFDRLRAQLTIKYNRDFVDAKGNAKIILELQKGLEKDIDSVNDAEVKNNQSKLDKITKAIQDANQENLDDFIKTEQERKAVTINQISEEQRHQSVLLGIKLKGNKNASTILLANEIANDEANLAFLKANRINNDQAELDEITKLNNQIIEKKKQLGDDLSKLDDAEKKAVKAALENLAHVTIDSINKVLSAQINSFDRQTSAQQKRVDDAAKIAEGGNSQLLELEKKRLIDLNKEKERFVRAQQALAAIELIADTAVMIAKAGAEGGAGAAITIAAAVIALIAGLASARSIAGQAAFYKGGYTGDGNPNEVSTNLGAKNYQYHKEEFIHNHQTTRKYLKHFRDIHSGKMDLNEVVQQASLYKMLSANGIDFNRDTSVRSSGNYQSMDELKSLMRDTTNAIKNQDRVNVRIDENGLAIIATSYINKQKRLNNLAR